MSLHACGLSSEEQAAVLHQLSALATDPDAVVENMRRNRAPETGRSVYFKREDFEKYGYTEGCEGCKRMRAGNMGY